MNNFQIVSFLLPTLINFLVLGFLMSKIGKVFRALTDDVRGELRIGREEARTAGRDMREEVGLSVKNMDEALRCGLEKHGQLQKSHYEGTMGQLRTLSEGNQAAIDGVRSTLDVASKELRSSNEIKLDAIRHEVAEGLKANIDLVASTLERMTTQQQGQLSDLNKQQKELAEGNQGSLDRIRDMLNVSVRDLQEGNHNKLGEVAKSVSESMSLSTDVLEKSLQTASATQREQIDALTHQMKELRERNEQSLERIRTSFDARVKEMQEGNEKKLEEMRKTVDEKLHDTLEKRLGESFKQVSDRLETVHKGLGEMQTLASGVGDLKRVLTNVKTRGTWAEVQLGAILEQILIPDQWAKNVCVREESSERVEYAVRLPGPKSDPDGCQWMPIDSKFPKEDYLRLQGAAENGDLAAVQSATEALLRELRRAAKDIHDKYVNPPLTTDFAIMFLATEGLYSEALRQQAFVEELQQKYRVVIAGPANLAALLSALRMGFQTLAVEQRAAEVWRVLGAVKVEFGKFGGVLDKVKKQLATASRTIEETGTRSRVMERRLRSVEQLNPVESAAVLALTPLEEESDEMIANAEREIELE
jgi:DNA recombination protein RmuC